MNVSMNFNDQITIENEDKTMNVIAYLSGTLNADKSFSMNVTVQDYAAFSANKATSEEKIQDFVTGVIDKVVKNCDAVAATATTTTTTN